MLMKGHYYESRYAYYVQVNLSAPITPTIYTIKFTYSTSTKYLEETDGLYGYCYTNSSNSYSHPDGINEPKRIYECGDIILFSIIVRKNQQFQPDVDVSLGPSFALDVLSFICTLLSIFLFWKSERMPQGNQQLYKNEESYNHEESYNPSEVVSNVASYYQPSQVMGTVTTPYKYT
ncbi:10308_t:CDS:2 [Cetraspora pellucida]|uniref:10308_t:CDS:1 n=1 Tax=Cetraspora pellucida TaxID=1433469 RepID=A0A9N9F1N7_9GLOM|nr:10308_t:CDS:2 [Cetraspora pellucida]